MRLWIVLFACCITSFNAIVDRTTEETLEFLKGIGSNLDNGRRIYVCRSTQLKDISVTTGQSIITYEEVSELIHYVCPNLHAGMYAGQDYESQLAACMYIEYLAAKFLKQLMDHLAKGRLLVRAVASDQNMRLQYSHLRVIIPFVCEKVRSVNNIGEAIPYGALFVPTDTDAIKHACNHLIEMAGLFLVNMGRVLLNNQPVDILQNTKFGTVETYAQLQYFVPMACKRSYGPFSPAVRESCNHFDDMAAALLRHIMLLSMRVPNVAPITEHERMAAIYITAVCGKIESGERPDANKDQIVALCGQLKDNPHLAIYKYRSHVVDFLG